MTDEAKSAGGPAWFGWPWTFPLGGMAPQTLTQPINPGWTFGNLISVTEQNSSAPDTERRIVAEQSYGRQIGRILDALAELIGERPEGPPLPTSLAAALDLQADIKRIKAQAAEHRLDSIRKDLESLKAHDPEAYRRQLAELRRLIG